MESLKIYWMMLTGVIRYKVAVHKANAKHMLTGKRYYVIPSPVGVGKVLIICNTDVKRMKKLHLIRKSFRHLELMECCLYFTDAAGKNDHSRMDKERRMSLLETWKNHIRRTVGK